MSENWSERDFLEKERTDAQEYAHELEKREQDLKEQHERRKSDLNDLLDELQDEVSALKERNKVLKARLKRVIKIGRKFRWIAHEQGDDTC